jgi:hypothetical protein
LPALLTAGGGLLRIVFPVFLSAVPVFISSGGNIRIILPELTTAFSHLLTMFSPATITFFILSEERGGEESGE